MSLYEKKLTKLNYSACFRRENEVNYYYEDVSTPPWLRDLVEEMSQREQDED